MKKIVKFILILIVLLGLGVGAFLGYVTLVDYDPQDVIPLEVNQNTEKTIEGHETFDILSWNIGFAGLNKDEDFFMDGGSKAMPDSKAVVEKNLQGIITTIESLDVDFSMLQEIDIKAKRTYSINEYELLNKVYGDYATTFATNYDVKFVPVPLPPLGNIKSGQAIYSKYRIEEATRYKLFSEYSWPKNTVMLDRCFHTSRINLQDKTGDLVLINAHFSAYDDGSLREQQLGAVRDFVIEEYKKGHYVVLGADWNQTFDFIDTSKFPVYMRGEFYTPSIVPEDYFGEDWSFGMPQNAPTYRLLNAAYEPGVTQVGVIDGFLVSPNVNILSSQVIDLKFEHTDHNPVYMTFELK